MSTARSPKEDRVIVFTSFMPYVALAVSKHKVGSSSISISIFARPFSTNIKLLNQMQGVMHCRNVIYSSKKLVKNAVHETELVLQVLNASSDLPGGILSCDIF